MLVFSTRCRQRAAERSARRQVKTPPKIRRVTNRRPRRPAAADADADAGRWSSWLEMAPALYESTAPWPTLAFLEAYAAPLHSKAQPRRARGLPLRQKARPNPPETCWLSRFQPGGAGPRAAPRARLDSLDVCVPEPVIDEDNPDGTRVMVKYDQDADELFM